MRGRRRAVYFVWPPARREGRDRVPIHERRDSRRLPARVPKLNRDLLTLRVREGDDFRPRARMCICPDACVLGRDAALWQDGGRLDYREAWAARDDAADCTNARLEKKRATQE